MTVCDDPSISDSEILLRRIRRGWIKRSQLHGNKCRPSSQAFQNLRDNAMSVWVKSVMLENGREPATLLEQFDGDSLVAFTVGDARKLGQGIVMYPEDGDSAHAHVVGNKKKAKSKFPDICSWEILDDPFLD
jgi:hypothetical protein